MKRQGLPAWSVGAIAVLVAVALTAPVAAQRHGSGGGSGGGQGQAVPRGSSGGDAGRVQERSAPRGGDRTDGQQGSSDPGSPATSRPRGDRAKTGDAVARTSPPPHDGGGHHGGSGGFYPWYGYGGYYGGYYAGYYGAYDPWFGWYPTSGSANADEDGDGTLRLKVKPVDASVYVDGYYAGIVDDFDGVFQRLHLEPGPHRIEIRAPEYEALSFDVLIEADHTTTYRGELTK